MPFPLSISVYSCSPSSQTENIKRFLWCLVLIFVSFFLTFKKNESEWCKWAAHQIPVNRQEERGRCILYYSRSIRSSGLLVLSGMNEHTSTRFWLPVCKKYIGCFADKIKLDTLLHWLNTALYHQYHHVASNGNQGRKRTIPITITLRDLRLICGT